MKRAGEVPHVASAPNKRAGEVPHVAIAPSKRAGKAPHVASAPSKRAGKAPHVASAPSKLLTQMTRGSRSRHHGQGFLLPVLLLMLLLQQTVAQPSSSDDVTTTTASVSDGSSREKGPISKSVDFEEDLQSQARSEDLDSFVKEGNKVISSVEYEGEMNDDGGAMSDSKFSSRRGRKLTWGEYISKSKEAPFSASRETFWDTRTEAPYSLPVTVNRYDHSSVPNSFSLNKNYYASSGHLGSDVRNSNTGNGYMGSDHFSSSANQGEGNYEDPGTPVPAAHDRILHQLAEYLLSGSKEQGISHPAHHQTSNQGPSDIHRSYSHTQHQPPQINYQPQQQQEKHIDYQPQQQQQHSTDYYSDLLSNHKFEGSEGIHEQPHQQQVPLFNASTSYSPHATVVGTLPHGQPTQENPLSTGTGDNTDDIDMTKILQDLADLMKILPEHAEEDGSETNHNLAGSAFKPQTTQSHDTSSYVSQNVPSVGKNSHQSDPNQPNSHYQIADINSAISELHISNIDFGHQIQSMSTPRPTVNHYFDQHFSNVKQSSTVPPPVQVFTQSPANPVYRYINTEKPVNMDPIIFTSKPIFTKSWADENYNPALSSSSQWSGAGHRVALTEAATTPSSVVGITDYDETFFKNPDYEYVDTDDPSFNSTGDAIHDEDYNEIKQKAQRRTLDLLYHMFVDPTTDKDGNRRNTLLEDLIKAVDNHIIGDVTALKEHSQSGKQGKTHFQENKSDFFKTLLESVGFDRPFMQSTANAFKQMEDTSASAASPAATRVPASIHYQEAVPAHPGNPNTTPRLSSPQAASNNQLIRQTRHPIATSVAQTASAGAATLQKQPQVHQLPSGDEYVITDETGQEQIISIGDIINSLASLNDEDIKELLLSPDINRRSDHEGEHHFDDNSHDQLVSDKNSHVKINNLIVLGKDGRTETIPFHDILSTPGEVLERPLQNVPPSPVVLATQHLFGGSGQMDSEYLSPTMQATHHLLGFSTERSKPQQTIPPNHFLTNNGREENPISGGNIVVSFNSRNRNTQHNPVQSETVSAQRTQQNQPLAVTNQNSAAQSYVQQHDNRVTIQPKVVMQRDQDSHYEMSSESQKILNDLFQELHEFKPKNNDAQQTQDRAHQLEQQNIKFLKHKADLDALQLQLQEQQQIQEEQQRALDKELEDQLLQIQYLQKKLKDTKEQQEVLSQTAHSTPPQTQTMDVNMHHVPSLVEPARSRAQAIPSNVPSPQSKKELYVESIPLQKTYVSTDRGNGETNVHVHSNIAQNGQDLIDALAKNIASVEAKAKAPTTWRSDTLANRSNEHRATEVQRRPSSPWLSDADNASTNRRDFQTFVQVREEAHPRQNAAPKTQHSVLLNAPTQKNLYDPEHHPNAHQYNLGLGTVPQLRINSQELSKNMQSLTQLQNIRFNNPPSLESVAANFPSNFNVNPPTKYGENLKSREKYQNSSSTVDSYEPRRDTGISAPAQLLSPNNPGVPAYDPNLFRAQVQQKQFQDERQRAMFASTMYDQVMKSLPKPIHFKQTTTPAPSGGGGSGLFGFRLPTLPNIFPTSHQHEEEKEEKDSSTEEIKWDDPLGLLRLYDLIPFTRSKSGDKEKQPVTPKPLSPEERLQEALKQGNVPDHVSKILVNQMKDNRIPAMPRTDNRRLFTVPQSQPRRQQVSNRRSYQVSPSVPNTFYHPPPPMTPVATSKMYGLSSSYEPPPALPYKIPRSFGPPHAGTVLDDSHSESVEGAQHYQKGVSSHFKTISNPQYDHSGDDHDHSGGRPSFKGFFQKGKGHHHDHSGGYGSNQASEEYDSYVVPIGYKEPPKEDQPLLDVSLLFNAVKVKKVGDDNESIAFPKIGDPSKFVDTGFYRSNHNY